jgi:hypothetical protein
MICQSIYIDIISMRAKEVRGECMNHKEFSGWFGILLAILIFSTLMGAYGIEITKKFGGPENDYGRSVRSTNDGFILAGLHDKDAWLVKTDKIGNIKWDKIIVGCIAASVAVTNDGNYITTGAKGSDLWLAKIDKANGAPIWERTFGGTGNSRGNCVSQTSDGGYAIAGTTNSKGAGKDDIWLIKTDSQGNKEWDQTFGWLYNDSGLVVHQIADGYILGGIFGFNDAEDKCIWLQKTDSDGNSKWRRLFAPTYPECCGGAEYGASVVPIKDGNKVHYLMAMTKCPGASLECDGWLIKIDESGWKSPWEKNIGDPTEDEISQIQLTKDGKGLVAVGTLAEGSSYAQIHVTKTDLEGNVIWSKNYPKDLGGFNTASGIDTTQDGGYVVVGSTYDHQKADQQMLLIIVSPDVVSSRPALQDLTSESWRKWLPDKFLPL